MEETRNDQIEAATPASTDRPTITELEAILAEKDVVVHIAPNGEATIAPSADAPDTAELLAPEPPPPPTPEAIAQAAYAKIAEELKFKGDFPAWENVSDRGRQMYVDATVHVMGGNTPRTHFEEMVAEVLKG